MTCRNKFDPRLTIALSAEWFIIQLFLLIHDHPPCIKKLVTACPNSSMISWSGYLDIMHVFSSLFFGSASWSLQNVWWAVSSSSHNGSSCIQRTATSPHAPDTPFQGLPHSHTPAGTTIISSPVSTKSSSYGPTSLLTKRPRPAPSTVLGRISMILELELQT